MTTFEQIKDTFGANWTTVLVGWTGLGVLSPWPEKWLEFPPLLTANEIVAFCDVRFTTSKNDVEQKLMIELISSCDSLGQTREDVRERVVPLSELCGGSSDIELKKWRVCILESVLDNLTGDEQSDFMAMHEFWLNFGFPEDAPAEFQTSNIMSCSKCVTGDSLKRLAISQRQWIAKEKKDLVAGGIETVFRDSTNAV